jgi:hypothetical protein
MSETRIEKEGEICARNLADKNQVHEHQCEEMGKNCEDMQYLPLVPSVPIYQFSDVSFS